VKKTVANQSKVHSEELVLKIRKGNEIGGRAKRARGAEAQPKPLLRSSKPSAEEKASQRVNAGLRKGTGTRVVPTAKT
jgi:hypothetical protein